jgi:uncharacterized protein with beta-barrel porin domain
MVEPLRHRQTKEAATDMFTLQPPRHIPTLPQTLTITAAQDVFAGTIAGSGGLTLTGGVEALTGTNIYTGPTTINGGFLLVDGIITGSSNVSVNATGTLAGTGIVDPLTVTINSGGTLAPGTPGGFGTLTIDGTLLFNAGSLYAINIARELATIRRPRWSVRRRSAAMAPW